MPLVREQNDRHTALEAEQDVLVEDVGHHAGLHAGKGLDHPGLYRLDPPHHIASCIGRQFGQRLLRLLQQLHGWSSGVVDTVLA